MGASPLMMLGMLKLSFSARVSAKRGLTHAFLKVDEDHIGEYLEAIPAPVDDYLGPVPELA